MRKALLFSLWSLCFIFLFSGCRTMPSSLREQTIAPEDRISISQGEGSGTWKGQDLAIDYSCVRAGSSLDLSGTVRFKDSIALGFPVLNRFRLRAILLDDSGGVLETSVLTTERGSTLDPIPFHKRLSIPAPSSSLSFGYDGIAIDPGPDGGPVNFWQNAGY